MREKIYIVALFVAIAIFHSATVRPGHIWADDFAMYVHHAQNIVEGRPYAGTGYIYNPSFPVYGPKYYPPIFPLLLTPIYRISGLNLIPMKLEQVLFLLLTLIAVYAYWKRDLGPGYTLALVAILGFAPAFWVAKDNVLSDIPFLFFFYLTALLVRNTLRVSAGWWRWSAVIGFAIYLAIGTRTVGIALVAGLVFYDALQLRTITRPTAVSIVVCAAFLVLQPYVIGGGHVGYFYQPPTLHTIARNIGIYARALASFWVGSAPNFFAYVVLALFAALVLAGFFFRWKRGFTFVEAALVPYLTIIVLWPFPTGVRAVFPVVPWIGYLAISGCKDLGKKLAPRYSLAAASAVFLLIAVCYVQAYRKVSFGPIHETMGLPEFNQVCQAVRDHTSPQDAIIYFRARALSLYTGRPASAYNYMGRDAELWQWARHIHAKYFITTNAFDEDRGFLLRFVQNNPRNLDLVYENATFKLYRIRSFPSALDWPEQQ
ncbi:MAG TPA: glycosyltransferase family 39 protein [Terriglobales bacterium]